MKAKLICYALGNVSHKIRSKFKREFFGYLDKSQFGGTVKSECGKSSV